MDETKLRAWRFHRQGLDGSLAGASPAEVLDGAGWARYVGGVGPYLTLFARARTSREAADRAVAKLQIHELPTARGCTYVVPAADFALGLKVGEPFTTAETRLAEKLGVTEKEIDGLCEAVLKALARGPLAPDAIRDAAGTAARSLGEAGKKKGLTTTLPVALGLLQAHGEIRRVPNNGRLDQQRYQYTLWKPNPLANYTTSLDDAYTELARHFFRWVGPATLGQFQAFAGLGVKAAREAVEPVGLVAVDATSDLLWLAADAEAFAAFKAPRSPCYALVSSLDAIAAARRDINDLLDPKDANRKVVNEKKVVAVGTLSDLPSHAILDRGRLVGLWEFDPESQSIVAATFIPKDRALEAAIRETQTFIIDQLGDARAFSLDSPTSRAPRIAAMRKLQ